MIWRSEKLLEDEESLKSLLQNFLPLPEGSVVEEAKREDKEENPDSITEPVGKTFILDLRVKIRRKEGDTLLGPEMVNVEIQTTRDNYFIDRLVAYTSRMYSGQLERGDGFHRLRPVYSLAFSTIKLDVCKGREGYYHTGCIRFDEHPRNIINQSTRYILVELGKFYGEVKNLIDKKASWCYLLKNSDKMEDWEFEIIKSKGEDMEHTVKRLQELSADGHTRAEVEAFEKQRLKHITENLTAREEGEEKKAREIALNMLAQSIDIAIISKSTGLTPEQIKTLKKQS